MRYGYFIPVVVIGRRLIRNGCGEVGRTAVECIWHVDGSNLGHGQCVAFDCCGALLVAIHIVIVAVVASYVCWHVVECNHCSLLHVLHRSRCHHFVCGVVHHCPCDVILRYGGFNHQFHYLLAFISVSEYDQLIHFRRTRVDVVLESAAVVVY